MSSGLESSGYRRLMAAGFADLVFERVVLENPGVFSEKARANARRRLDALEQVPLNAENEGGEHLGNGEYSTRMPLEDVRDDSDERAVEEDVDVVQRRDDIDSTTKEALVKARRGQGQFRLDMLKLWQGRCAVTDLAVVSVLVASHAVAWKDSTDAERLDGHNGLLLAATIDKLFDRYLIAFDPSTRQMLLSQTLTSSDREKIGLPLSIRRSLSTKQADYLARHREIFFLREENRSTQTKNP
ncbi:HNH endonuclease [Paraburkholderia sp. EG285A]|uniref:HNH endonuclease n=1 Tax=Paraburkholderia sp. EG285A TaxID=3237009 RepID=UPI0034D2591C